MSLTCRTVTGIIHGGMSVGRVGLLRRNFKLPSVAEVGISLSLSTVEEEFKVTQRASLKTGLFCR